MSKVPDFGSFTYAAAFVNNCSWVSKKFLFHFLMRGKSKNLSAFTFFQLTETFVWESDNFCWQKLYSGSFILEQTTTVRLAEKSSTICLYHTVPASSKFVKGLSSRRSEVSLIEASVSFKRCFIPEEKFLTGLSISEPNPLRSMTSLKFNPFIIFFSPK